MSDATRRPGAFFALAAFFGLFVLFLYGPMIAIVALSFQGPEGGLTFRCAAGRCIGSRSSGKGSAWSTSAARSAGRWRWAAS